MAAAARTDQYLTLFRAALGQSARDSEALLREVFHATLRSLEAEIARSGTQLERDQLRICHKTLDHKAAVLCAQFPALLRKAFLNKLELSSQFGELALGELNHEQLEQMDESQVQERIEMARVLRFVQHIVRDSLSELNGFINALLGSDHVKPQRNPLRPQIYLKVLHLLMIDAAVPVQMRIMWLSHMASALGKALQGSYSFLAQKIQSYGVVPLPISRAGVSGSLEVGVLAEQPTSRQTNTNEPSDRPHALTLDRLHELLAGQLADQRYTPPDEAETQLARVWTQTNSSRAEVSHDQADDTATDFFATIPATFEALQNLNQADDIMPPMRRPTRSATGSANKLVSMRQTFRSRCENPAQILSLDVMCKMVDSLVRDTRLQEPIRKVIENLEPALFQMVMHDVRFFNNKNHPARRLLQEITQRGIAFHSVEAPGFALFIRSLHRYVNPLSRMPITSPEPFEHAIINLNKMWLEESVASSQTVEQATQVLVRAEERNILAEKMDRVLEQIPDMQRVPAAVAEFLCGPWAQVMACAELNNTEGGEDPGDYKRLVNVLLWSAQPGLARKDTAKLSKLIPKLLLKLREGLALIDYPPLKTSSFFDVLMRLHQQALRPESGESEQLTSHPKEKFLRNHQHWVAPAEAQATGFMDMPAEEAVNASAQPNTVLSSESMLDSVIPVASQINLSQAAPDIEQLELGAWVEMGVNGVWQRSQLNWISPQKSLYLFANVYGGTQSMTRSSLEKLLATNALHLLSGKSMVDGALDSVVQTAMLNSLDMKL
ncbi:DUF1631 family protein [Rhodoferax sp.]|uniref:DUF1631 family protein n=1 Tax=Rhodoferax sp. TaxID=50421 RepID=UPI0025CCC75C|nr:DUF1631 family protein [Rhodoferax sp.]